jgi:miniconductance mechanosensitive channel
LTELVRQRDLSEIGVALELYCFTDTTEWLKYEDIQSDIFDHLLAVLPFFELRIFQQPTGYDIQQLETKESKTDRV